MELKNIKNSWKGVTKVSDMQQLIDMGIMLRWADMRPISKSLPESDQEQIMRHFAVRLAERVDMRLSAEIVVESMLVWLSQVYSQSLVNILLDELFDQPGFDAAAKILVEIALTSEISDPAHEDEIFAMAVSLVCELGIRLKAFHQAYPEELPHINKLLDHVAGYLLSVSNFNNGKIRLSLFLYFVSMEKGAAEKVYLPKIMHRFGHTVLDQLFTLLFKKRSEAIALQFLLDNLPGLLETEVTVQRIIHDTFKFYLLKKPERFTLFLKTLARTVAAMPGNEGDIAGKSLLMHIGAMLNILSDVRHKGLIHELSVALLRLKANPFYHEFIEQIRQTSSIRKEFKEYINKVQEKDEVGKDEDFTMEEMGEFKSAKRGRKPSFAKKEVMGRIHLVAYLGQTEVVAKAS